MQIGQVLISTCPVLSSSDDIAIDNRSKSCYPIYMPETTDVLGTQTPPLFNFMNSTIFPCKNDPSVVTIWNLYSNYKGAYAPEEFQRPESWSAKERKAYFLSVLMNRIEGTFVFVDAEIARARVESIDPTDISYTYFNNLLKEMIEKIILEGNNRLKFLEALLNDEYTIPSGTYYYLPDPHSTSLSQFVVGKHNNVFSKLSKLVQKAIKGRKVIVSEYTQIDYKGLSDVFVNVNSGVPLNPQELRNALHTEWAKYVREIRKEIAPLLMFIFGDKYKRRLVGDEWIAECIDMYLHNFFDDEEVEYKFSGVTQTSKNKLYVSDYEDFDPIYITEKFLTLQSYIERLIDEDHMDQKEITKKSTVMNLFWMMCNGIDTYDQAVESLIRHEVACKDKDLVNDANDSYRWACGGTGTKNMEFRMEVLPKIVKKVTSKVSS